MMDAQASGLWWTLALLDGAIGSGILVYGVRQKEWRSLLCGLVLNVLPMLGLGDTGLLLFSAGSVVAYVLSFNLPL